MPELGESEGRNDSEKSLVFVKAPMYNEYPEVIDEISIEIKKRSLRILSEGMIQLTPDFVAQHYYHKHDQPYYQELIDDNTSGPIYAFIVEGKNAVAECIDMMGAKTDPALCSPSSFRKQYGKSPRFNSFHRSGDKPDAGNEVPKFEKLIDAA